MPNGTSGGVGGRRERSRLLPDHRRIVGSDAVESGHAALRTRAGPFEGVTKLAAAVGQGKG
jgi:hypothetical protein